MEWIWIWFQIHPNYGCNTPLFFRFMETFREEWKFSNITRLYIYTVGKPKLNQLIIIMKECFDKNTQTYSFS